MNNSDTTFSIVNGKLAVADNGSFRAAKLKDVKLACPRYNKKYDQLYLRRGSIYIYVRCACHYSQRYEETLCNSPNCILLRSSGVSLISECKDCGVFSVRGDCCSSCFKRKYFCATCGKASTTDFLEDKKVLPACGGCGIVHYCSPVCQKANWKAHKAQCKAFQAIVKK